MMKQKILIAVMSALSFLLSAQNDLQIESSIDWSTGIFQLDITTEIEEEPNQPTGRYKTEQYIMRQTAIITGEVLQQLTVDSSHRIADLIEENPVLLRDLELLSEKMEKVFTTATADRKKLTVRYTLSLFPDLVDLIIKHSKPYPILENRDYIANEDFTGIVIYAGEALPHHGHQDKMVQLTPCLFPKLFDSSMNLIHSAEMTETEVLAQWGNAAYTQALSLSDYSQRIGVYPLKTMARKIYGSNATDLILPDDVVHMITASEHNRNLLRQGKVLIILPPEEE